MKTILATILTLALAAIPAAAKQTLTVYTYDSFVSEWGPGARIKEAFEKDCDCSIDWVALGDGVAVLNRLKLKVPQPRPMSSWVSTPTSPPKPRPPASSARTNLTRPSQRCPWHGPTSSSCPSTTRTSR